jgi:hypothetical protein
LAQRDDFATVGQNEVSLVDADSFWIDAYFEETKLASIQEGDTAKIKLMGYRKVILGRVGSISRAISVANAQPNQQGVATVNPIFTWVRSGTAHSGTHRDWSSSGRCGSRGWHDGHRRDRTATRIAIQVTA